MELSKNLKKILLASASLLMIGSVMSTNNIANAKHRRYYYHTHRQMKHRLSTYKFGYWRHYRKHGHTHYYWYRYKTGYFHYNKWVNYKHSNTHHHSNRGHWYNIWGTYVNLPNHRVYKQALKNVNNGKYMIKASKTQGHYGKLVVSPLKANNTLTTKPNSTKTNSDELKIQSLKDINKDRRANGLAPLAESETLNKIANIRAKQLGNNFSHTDSSTGKGYAEEDGNQIGYNIDNHDWGENIAQCILGPDTDGEGHTFTANNGKQMANEAETNMTKYDQDEGNGHRDIILSNDYTQVGIGTNYKDGNYNLAEDFTN